MKFRRPVLRSGFAAVLLTLALASATLAVLVWPRGTVSATPEATIRSLVIAEHNRVCSTPLVSNAALTWAARWKAQDMGYRGYLSHQAPGGKYVWDFYARVGIPWAHGAGEIIGWNSYPDDVSAAAVFHAWMASPSHRSAIRTCGYDHFGVGAFKAGTQKYFAVEFTNR